MVIIINIKINTIKGNICLDRLSFNWQPAVLFIDEKNPSKGIKLAFPPGQSCIFEKNKAWTLTYILNCDQYVEEPQFNSFNVNLCSVQFIFSTKYSCESQTSTGENAGKGLFNSIKIVFVILTLFLIYCIVFCYLNYKDNPEDGLIKSFPNRTLWICFCESFYHGVKFSCGVIKEMIKKLTS